MAGKLPLVGDSERVGVVVTLAMLGSGTSAPPAPRT